MLQITNNLTSYIKKNLKNPYVPLSLYGMHISYKFFLHLQALHVTEKIYFRCCSTCKEYFQWCFVCTLLDFEMLINTLQTSFPSAQIYLAHKNSVVSWSKAMKQCVLQQYENNDTDKETLDLKGNKFWDLEPLRQLYNTIFTFKRLQGLHSFQLKTFHDFLWSTLKFLSFPDLENDARNFNTFKDFQDKYKL